MQALPGRDNSHPEVIDLDGGVRKGSAFTVEREVVRWKFRLYSSRFFLLGKKSYLGHKYYLFYDVDSWHVRNGMKQISYFTLNQPNTSK